MASSDIPYREIVAELRRLCANKSNGNFLVMNDDGALFQVGLREGEIVNVFFRGRRGKEALPLAASMKSGRPQFSEGVVLARGLPLPPTQEILDFLGGTRGPERFAPGRFVAPQSPPGTPLPADMVRALEEELAVFIGPVAAIVCAERLVSVSDLETALSSLSEELHVPSQVAQFRNGVLKRLGRA
jgi:hypothetical protein